MRVGIDIDDCLANFTGRFAELARDKFGRPPAGTKPSDWNWSNFGLSPDQIKDIWADIKSTYNFWMTLDREEGVADNLIRRLDCYHTVFFPTARDSTKGLSVTKQSARWLADNYGIWFPTVFVSSDKEALATALQYDYFIDDRPKNCVAVKLALPDCKVYLKNSSHNENWTGHSLLFEPIPRLPSVNEFCDLILGGGVN
jgi:hypothetical protein